MDFNSLLDQLNCSAQTAVSVKSEILHSVLRVFQLDSQKKAVFREVCGFHYLISTLASLIGSLAPRRSSPWVGGKQGMRGDLDRQILNYNNKEIGVPPGKLHTGPWKCHLYTKVQTSLYKRFHCVRCLNCPPIGQRVEAEGERKRLWGAAMDETRRSSV